MSLLDDYRRLMNEHLFFRAAEGGTLPLEIESAFVDRLDDVWWRLSEADQERFEAELQSACYPRAPLDLAVVDCVAGDMQVPRSAA